MKTVSSGFFFSFRCENERRKSQLTLSSVDNRLHQPIGCQP